MSGKLDALFTGARPPGVYRATLRTRAEALCREAEGRGWRCFHLDGRHIASKAEFLTAGARALNFPSYFGANWDALEESLNDMSWAPGQGYLVVFDRVARFAEAQPDEFAVALDILRESVQRWAARGVPLVVLLRGAGRAAQDAPVL